MHNFTIAKYLAIPVAFTLGLEFYARGIHLFDLSRMLGGGFFYTLPFALWALPVKIAKLSNPVSHSGFIGCALSLALISSFWFLPPDPSGLPMQWMMYWPLSAILVLLGSIGTAVWRRTTA